MAKPLLDPGDVAFTATILRGSSGSSCRFVEFPVDSEAAFGRRGNVDVRVSFAAAAGSGRQALWTRGPLYRHGRVAARRPHILLLRKEVREALGVESGDVVDVVVRVPPGGVPKAAAAAPAGDARTARAVEGGGRSATVASVATTKPAAAAAATARSRGGVSKRSRDTGSGSAASTDGAKRVRRGAGDADGATAPSGDDGGSAAGRPGRRHERIGHTG